MEYNELTSILDSYSSILLGKYPHRYLVFNLENINNSGLYQLLEESGYWNFAPSKSKKLVGYHQIVSFFLNRKDMPEGSGDFHEVHHIDGNTMNNHPSNLIYLSPRDHSIVTKYQRKLTKLKVKQFYKLQKALVLSERTQYNRQGKLIRNWTKFILGVICLTVSKSNQWLGNISKPVKLIVDFVTRWLKRTNSVSTIDDLIPNYVVL